MNGPLPLRIFGIYLDHLICGIVFLVCLFLLPFFMRKKNLAIESSIFEFEALAAFLLVALISTYYAKNIKYSLLNFIQFIILCGTQYFLAIFIDLSRRKLYYSWFGIFILCDQIYQIVSFFLFSHNSNLRFRLNVDYSNQNWSLGTDPNLSSFGNLIFVFFYYYWTMLKNIKFQPLLHMPIFINLILLLCIYNSRLAILIFLLFLLHELYVGFTQKSAVKLLSKVNYTLFYCLTAALMILYLLLFNLAPGSLLGSVLDHYSILPSSFYERYIQITNALKDFFSNTSLLFKGYGFMYENTHNTFINSLINTGVIGLISFTCYLFFLLSSARGKKIVHSYRAIFFLSSFIIMLFFYRIKTLFWITIFFYKTLRRWAK